MQALKKCGEVKAAAHCLLFQKTCFLFPNTPNGVQTHGYIPLALWVLSTCVGYRPKWVPNTHMQ